MNIKKIVVIIAFVILELFFAALFVIALPQSVLGATAVALLFIWVALSELLPLLSGRYRDRFNKILKRYSD